jgi:hypothetical protein
MPDIVSTIRNLLTGPRRRRRDLVVSAYCAVHGVDERLADGDGRSATDRD